jgi:chitin disaccharide deacetylase
MGALATRPDLIEVYVRTGIEYDLPVLFMRGIDPQQAAAYPALARQAEEMIRLLDEKGLPVLDHLVQFYGGDGHEERRARYLEALHRCRPASAS